MDIDVAPFDKPVDIIGFPIVKCSDRGEVDKVLLVAGAGIEGGKFTRGVGTVNIQTDFYAVPHGHIDILLHLDVKLGLTESVFRKIFGKK
jgi:hypothetical protein